MIFAKADKQLLTGLILFQILVLLWLHRLGISHEPITATPPYRQIQLSERHRMGSCPLLFRCRRELQRRSRHPIYARCDRSRRDARFRLDHGPMVYQARTVHADGSMVLLQRRSADRRRPGGVRYRRRHQREPGGHCGLEDCFPGDGLADGDDGYRFPLGGSG